MDNTSDDADVIASQPGDHAGPYKAEASVSAEGMTHGVGSKGCNALAEEHGIPTLEWILHLTSAMKLGYLG